MSGKPTAPENEPGTAYQTTYTDTQKQLAVFERLKQHGIDYQKVREAVEFDLPQNPFFFARQFGSRTIREVIRHIESWKLFLKREFLLTAEVKAKIEWDIKATEAFIWAAIRDANYEIGDWIVQWTFTEVGKVETPDGEHVGSGLRVTATNRTTGEKRAHEVPGSVPSAPRAVASEYTEIFKALGLFDELWLGSPRPFYISRRSRQGWPVFSRMIRRLYEVMAPHYKSRGYYSERTGGKDAFQSERRARYPKELLEDMLAVLRMHHPWVFSETTANHLKSAIQHHLERQTHTPPAP